MWCYHFNTIRPLILIINLIIASWNSLFLHHSYLLQSFHNWELLVTLLTPLKTLPKKESKLSNMLPSMEGIKFNKLEKMSSKLLKRQFIKFNLLELKFLNQLREFSIPNSINNLNKNKLNLNKLNKTLSKLQNNKLKGKLKKPNKKMTKNQIFHKMNNQTTKKVKN